MKRLTRSLALAVVFALWSITLAWAKGAPPKITISGPGLEGAVEVANWEGLGCIAPGALFRPTEPISAPLQKGDGYEVVRYAWSTDGTYRPFDRLHYYLHPAGGAGYIFYDGGAAFGGRSEGEGQWYHATPVGEAAMLQLLHKLGVSVAQAAPSINLADVCAEYDALDPGEHYDKATVSGPGLKGVVEISDPHGLLVLGQPLSSPFWQTSWTVNPQFGTGYALVGYFKNGDAYLNGDTLRYYPHPNGGRAWMYANRQWYVLAPEVDAALRGVLKSLGATLDVMPNSGVARVVADAPPRLVAGRASQVGFNIRELDGGPAEADMALVYLSWEQSRSASVFVARPDGTPGHYSVPVRLSQPGTWYWSVVWGPANEQVEMAPFSVTQAVPVAEPAGLASAPDALAYVAALMLALIVASVVFGWRKHAAIG